MNKDEIKDQIMHICTYHGDEGTSGYLLTVEQFKKLFDLYDQAISQAKKETAERFQQELDGGLDTQRSWANAYELSNQIINEAEGEG